MSTRAYEEVELELNNALALEDVASIERCIEELDGVDTAQAMAMVATARGTVDRFRGKYPQSIEHYRTASKLYKELGDSRRVIQAAGNIAIVFAQMSDFPAALEHLHATLSLCEEHNDDAGKARVITNIGTVCERTGDYPAALGHFHKALAYYEEVGDRVGVAAVSTSIGAAYNGMGDVDAALRCFQNALTLNEALGRRIGVATALGNIGSVYATSGDSNSALEYMQRATALAEELDDRDGVEWGWANIGSALMALGRIDEVRPILARIFETEITMPDIRVFSLLLKARVASADGDLDNASNSLQLALDEARTHSLRAEQATVSKALRDLALAKNDLAGYVEYNGLYTSITEDVKGREATLKIAMLEKQREIDAKDREHQKHMAVLHSTLPKHVAERVARGEVVNDSFDNAAILFIDVVGFTSNSSELEANVVVALLQNIFTTFDAVCAEFNLMKIKTIGDSYMAVAFPSDEHIINAARAALAMQACEFTWPHTNKRVMFRSGIHCGPVVAGVLGTERMQYDVWGDTVNVASRMESSGEAGRVHVSEAFALNLEEESRFKNQESNHEFSDFIMHERGEIDIKGKGPMQTYWLEVQQ